MRLRPGGGGFGARRLSLPPVFIFFKGATIYFYSPFATGGNDHSDFFSAEVLKVGMHKALVPFYLSAGRLGMDENGRTEIKCNGKGVLFVEDKSDDLSIDKLGEFVATSSEHRRLLIPTMDPDEGDDIVPLILL
ncbi:hypothetical protein Cni_G16328 [Canna indica]|uniref:Uncharacterized protein n=1 Tax=Canna indica TaxID=4628 RepID=A0AAQ3KEW0_9LILI|nr:hypothetical protein Cni_G16328 [Canna indica]